jgi:hypothetical protein
VRIIDLRSTGLDAVWSGLANREKEKSAKRSEPNLGQSRIHRQLSIAGIIRQLTPTAPAHHDTIVSSSRTCHEAATLIPPNKIPFLPNEPNNSLKTRDRAWVQFQNPSPHTDLRYSGDSQKRIARRSGGRGAR